MPGDASGKAACKGVKPVCCAATENAPPPWHHRNCQA